MQSSSHLELSRLGLNLNRSSWIILAITTLAELSLIFANPSWSLVLHIVLIIFIIFVSVSEPEDSPVYRYYISLLLIPLIRILSLALPLAAWSQATWYAAVSIPLFVTMFILTRRFAFTRIDLALGDFNPWHQFAIALVGIPLGLTEYLILTPAPLIPTLTWELAWFPALILMVSTGFLEELLFRGLLQKTSLTLFSPTISLLFVSTLFAVLHIGYASLADVAFVFSAGLLFGIIVYRTNSLLGVTIAHGLTNIGLFIFWPFVL